MVRLENSVGGPGGPVGGKDGIIVTTAVTNPGSVILSFFSGCYALPGFLVHKELGKPVCTLHRSRVVAVCCVVVLLTA